MDFFFHKTADFRVAELKFKGNQDVKYNIGMGRALYNPEIMEIQRLVQFMEAAGDLLFQFLGLFIVIHNRIHMYYRVTVQLTVQLTFNIVDGIVQVEHVSGGGHFRMQGNHDPARAVIMHDEIMDAQHLRIALHNGFYLFHKFLLRRLAEQGADGILCCAVAIMAALSILRPVERLYRYM